MALLSAIVSEFLTAVCKGLAGAAVILKAAYKVGIGKDYFLLECCRDDLMSLNHT